MLWLGAGSAVASCATGWLLGDSGEYAEGVLFWHRWLGIGTAVAAVAACFLKSRLVFNSLAAVLLIATGHLGATLTHGEAYLSATFQTEKETADIQEAQLYADLIAPILQEKCQSCHGPTKQKGGLRLDSPELILKGGKNGAAIVPGNVSQGELLRRCLLPTHDDDHMPPKQKPQLTPAELEILQWWIAEGADFQKRVKEIAQSEKIEAALAQLTAPSNETITEASLVPEKNAPPASPALIEKIRHAGVFVRPVAQGSNWLTFSFFNLPQPPDSVFFLLEQLAPQAVWLNLSGCKIPENAWQNLGKLVNLTRLDLANSSVSDTALAQLKGLTALQKLNLANTQTSAEGLTLLSGLAHLRNIFLYKTKVSGSDWEMLQTNFPHTKIDTGGYALPFLETDTLRLK